MKRIQALLPALLLSIATLGAAVPKYIFYFIGDGMGMGPVMAAETYRRTVLNSDKPLTMTSMPVASWVMTYSASSTVTDSAAAGTALSTGHKTNNGMVGMNADTIAVESVANRLAREGYAVGVVSAAAVDDATPAAFYAHVPRRSMSYEINRQFPDGMVDFIAGASMRGAVDSKGEKTDIADYYAERGVRVAYGLDEYLALADPTASKVVLLDRDPFQSGNVGYAIDSVASRMSLLQMTETALGYLEKKSPEKFFLMVEGSNIDHALHGHDAGTAVSEILDFDKSIALAYEFMLNHPDETLIVVTADHDTGGLSVGNARTRYNSFFEIFADQKVSKEMFSDWCKAYVESGSDAPSWDEVYGYLEQKLGFGKSVKLSDKELENLKRLYVETFVERSAADQKTLYNSFNRFATEVFDLQTGMAGAGFGSSSHTGNPVPLFATGAGSEIFAGVNNNIDVPAKIARAAGL